MKNILIACISTTQYLLRLWKLTSTDDVIIFFCNVKRHIEHLHNDMKLF